ncbi:alpha/beta hydrolase family esterase [Corynebacterium kozikiae]|uniref:alpha/beta hydrolase family esterase n=1 Tax=Corynebacterium kozikiae TaxID=2968469 RepID=UPI00211B9933|nr:poly(3-hydroxyalkanoate) depolymerase [Corynebacterium sp. 76QC2CO]MCQ9343640.1 poly(3-hydroxyalkanoate) depolymerase [Corynebacterium sp. 76QC2CO]
MRQHLIATQNGTDLLLYFHGSQQSARVARRFTNRSFEHIQATVVYPEGVHRHWNDSRKTLPERTRELGTDDVSYIQDLIAHIPHERVFAAGYSNGAQMIIRLLHDAPGLLAGAALIAGTMPTPENFLSTAQGWIPTPILTMHGTEDPIAPFDGGSAGSRGAHRSFTDSNLYFVQHNGLMPKPRHTRRQGFDVYDWAGEAPVQAWVLNGVGHHVPTTRPVASPFLGPASTHFVAAEAIAQFFGLGFSLDGAGGQTR